MEFFHIYGDCSYMIPSNLFNNRDFPLQGYIHIECRNVCRSHDEYVISSSESLADIRNADCESR